LRERWNIWSCKIRRGLLLTRNFAKREELSRRPSRDLRGWRYIAMINDKNLEVLLNTLLDTIRTLKTDILFKDMEIKELKAKLKEAEDGKKD
jgi:hypothetical protein